MRVLIISVRFDDQSLIGSVRPRSFATWLAEFGHEVTVITRPSAAVERPEDPPGVSVVRVPLVPLRQRLSHRSNRVCTSPAPFSRGSDATASASRRGSSSMVSGLKRFYGYLNNALWIVDALQSARNLERSDVVFSTYGPVESHLIARWLTRGAAGAPWVADFRDLMVQNAQGLLTRAYFRHLQGDIVRKAEAVTCVSRGLAEALAQGSNGLKARRIHVVSNGFNPISADVARRERPTDNILRIAYTGNMYGGRRDTGALFTTLAGLIEGGFVDPQHVEVHYAGWEGHVLRDQAARHSCGNLVVDHGPVTRDAALRLQRISDILLVLSWNTQGERGILTGKVYDYLAAARPILALTGGDLANSELTELIRELRVGYGYEYVQAAAHDDGLRQFLLDAYQRRLSGQHLDLAVDGRIDQYRYDRITRRLEGVFEDVLKARPS